MVLRSDCRSDVSPATKTGSVRVNKFINGALDLNDYHIKGSLKPAAAFNANLRKSVFRIPWYTKFFDGM